MGTHSLIIMRVKQHDGSYSVWAILYQQFDGDLNGVGAQLCKFLLPIKLVNGFDPTNKTNVANGASCLFAQLISYFKVDVGGAYLSDPTDESLEGYNYYVDVDETMGNIELALVDYKKEELFRGSVQEFVDKYELDLNISTPKESKERQDAVMRKIFGRY